MADAPKTKPSKLTREEEERDARIAAGADQVEGAPEPDGTLDPDVAEHYEEMIERGANQQGEGRLP